MKLSPFPARRAEMAKIRGKGKEKWRENPGFLYFSRSIFDKIRQRGGRNFLPPGSSLKKRRIEIGFRIRKSFQVKFFAERPGVFEIARMIDAAGQLPTLTAQLNFYFNLKKKLLPKKFVFWCVDRTKTKNKRRLLCPAPAPAAGGGNIPYIEQNPRGSDSGRRGRY